MRIIYYQAFLLYSKIMPSIDPHRDVIWGISAVEGFVLFRLWLIISTLTKAGDGKAFYFWVIMIVLYFFNKNYYYQSGRHEQILKDKPLLWGSVLFSRILTLIFFGIGIACLFVDERAFL